MASDADILLKVGADFSGLTTGVDIAKAKLDELRAANIQLKDEIKKLTKSIDDNYKSLRSAESELANTNKLTSAGRKKYAELSAEVQKLTGTIKAQESTLISNKVELAQSSTAIRQQTIAVKQAETAHSGFASGASKAFGALRKLAYLIPGIGIGGLVSLIAGPLITAFTDWAGITGEVAEQQKKVAEFTKSAIEDISKEASQITQLVAVAASDVSSKEQRIDAIKKLQDVAPGYFDNIDTEKFKINDLNFAYRAYLNSLKQRISLQINKDKINTGVTQELTLENDLITANKELANAIKARDAAAKSNQAGQAMAGLNMLVEEARNRVDKLTKSLEKTKKGNEDLMKSFGIQMSGETSGTQELFKQLGKDFEKLSQQEKTFKTDKTKEKLDLVRNAIVKLRTEFAAMDGNPLLTTLENWATKLEKEVPKKVKRGGETINGVLEKLKQSLKGLSEQEILFKTDKSKDKIKEIENAINKLTTKFKLTSENKVLVDLNAQKADIELTKEFKDYFKGQRTEPLVFTPPIEVKPDEVYFSKDWEQIFAKQDIIGQLKKLGVKKTLKGQLVEYAPEFEDLQATLKATVERMTDMAYTVTDLLAPAFDSVFDSLMNGDNAFENLDDAIQGIIKSLAQAVIKAAIFAGILSLLGGGSFGSLFKGVLGFADGGKVQKRADGGYISGPGGPRSDLIPAMLSNGEYVIRASRVQSLGKAFFDKINFGGMVPNVSGNRFANGGMVGGSSFASIGGGVNVTGEFQIRNSVLVAAVERGGKQLKRFS